MKYIRILTLLVITSASCFAAVTKAQLVGTWTNVWPGKGTAVVEFRDDGIFTATIRFENGRIYSKRGTWSLKDEQILYEYRDEKGNVTSKDVDELLSITGDSFVILAQDGGKRTYKKSQK